MVKLIYPPISAIGNRRMMSQYDANTIKSAYLCGHRRSHGRSPWPSKDSTLASGPSTTIKISTGDIKPDQIQIPGEHEYRLPRIDTGMPGHFLSTTCRNKPSSSKANSPTVTSSVITYQQVCFEVVAYGQATKTFIIASGCRVA